MVRIIYPFPMASATLALVAYARAAPRASALASPRRRTTVSRATDETAAVSAESDAPSSATGSPIADDDVARDGSRASASSSRYDGVWSAPPPKRETPLERVARDPLLAAVMAPRVALGGLDLLGKGELLSVAVSAAGEFRALIDDPRPVQDKAADALKRAEEMVEMLEDRGIEAETPGRELVRPVVPPDLYDKYLDPAASKPPPPMTTTYAAEPRTYAASPPPPSEEKSTTAEEKSTTPPSRSYDFSDEEDPAVAEAAAAVAAALDAAAAKEKEEKEGQEEGAVASPTAIVENASDASAPSSSPRIDSAASTSSTFGAPAFELPAVPPDLWAAVEEAEKLAADLVMGQSTAVATKTAKK